MFFSSGYFASFKGTAFYINYFQAAKDDFRFRFVDRMRHSKNKTTVLKYIDRYWKKTLCYNPLDRGIYLGVPNKYVAPNTGIFKNDMFYWDTFFTSLGLIKSNKLELVRGMVENFIYLYKRFGIVPMRNRYYNLGTSQIPFLTSMIFEVYNVDKNKRWLRANIKYAELELKKYWMNESLTEKHIVYKGLSRYCDHYITHLGAEHESGWDMTSRFSDRCLDFLPVDLNACLYKYETDLARAYEILGNSAKAAFYANQALKRKKAINKLMWNNESGCFFDYNKKRSTRSSFISVAAFYPLWAKLASKDQARILRDKILPMLEFKGGVANTWSENLSEDFKQHDYPNGWPQQQYIVVQGLLNYGFYEDAERIALKWLKMNDEIFAGTKTLWEKYDVVKGEVGKFNPDRYPTQSGFGWTNSIYVWLYDEFVAKKGDQGVRIN